MNKNQENADAPPASQAKKSDVLSFKVTGRPLHSDGLVAEFRLMLGFLKKSFSAEIAFRICQKSGSHMIKLVSPRVDGDHAVLRFDETGTNRISSILPSVNAPDIPFCKVVFRPLEVIGHPTMSVVDHILNPSDMSDAVLEAFAEVFGADVLLAMQESLLSEPSSPSKLGAGEFPIIFIPRPGGGDLQVTPVSPALTFTGMRELGRRRFQKRDPEGPRINRGKWIDLAVSSKPQNISGAIGGPRVRFLATMPAAMHQSEAELYRYVHGGRFPRWHDQEVSVWVLRYADMLDATYNNANTRAALDRTADRLIGDAAEFLLDTLADARRRADEDGIVREQLPEPPAIPELLIRRYWGKDPNYDRARMALTSPHFEDRLRKSRLAEEVHA
ncbi:hypothetical protein [Martelella soudanensis]|uniref:hypothetical protein n=1 Tax=unclassified Martelella TaxID=2629616 RepID=UPI0015DEE631|nr:MULTISPECIES: hypothetical protein [unclassified Martelella]